MQFQYLFPTTVGFSECPFIDEIQDKYKKIIEKFDYNADGFCGHRVHQNNKFKKLNKWIDDQIHTYAKRHLYKGKYSCKESWLLDYPIGAGQSFHRHPGFTFSCVFFLEGYEYDSTLNFENPIIDMKNPLNFSAYDETNNEAYNELTYQVIKYPPKSGRLYVWRSYLAHGVFNKLKNCKRIVFTYNYDQN